MPVLTAPVGKGGLNHIHDVAAVQGALAIAVDSRRRPFWQGPVDGRRGRPVEQAIAAFQHANRLPVTGLIYHSGSDISRLKMALPSSHQGIRGLQNTASLWRATRPVRRWRLVAEEISGTAPLPKPERQALADIVGRLARHNALGTEIAEVSVTADGRFRVRLEAPGVEWYDATRKRFVTHLALPEPARRSLRQALRGNPHWREVTTTGPSGLLDLDTQRAIPALKGAPMLDASDLALLGLASPPTHPVARTCLVGCARLIRAGAHRAGPERADFQALVEVVELLSPGATKNIGADTSLAQNATFEFDTFGGFERSSIIKTPRSGEFFDSPDSAFFSAHPEAQDLARQYYPSEINVGELDPGSARMIPELGVIIWETVKSKVGRRRSFQYHYDGFIVGVRNSGMSRGGFVGWDTELDNGRIAARGHWHWINSDPSPADIDNARNFSSARQRLGRDYTEFVASYGGWTRIWNEGKEIEREDIYHDFR